MRNTEICLGSKAHGFHGARSVLMHLDHTKERLGRWVDELRARMHVNKVTVAPAAKLARVVLVVSGKPVARYELRAPEGSVPRLFWDAQIAWNDDKKMIDAL